MPAAAAEPPAAPPAGAPPAASAQAQTEPLQPSAAATVAAPTPAATAQAASGASTTTSTAQHPRRAPEVGLAPGTPQTGSSVLLSPTPSSEPASKPADDTWRFDYKGFLRVPARLGFGMGRHSLPNPMGLDPAPVGPREGKLHAPPYIPDGVFTDWRYTNNLPGPWTELRLLYGNKRVTGNVIIAAYDLTDGGYRNLQAQLGINQAFVTLDESDLLGANGGLIWNVGVFNNAYGAAGRYDAGKYDTYLFGRTHTGGETLTAFYHINDDLTVTLEHGVGVKLEVAPFVSGLPQPNPAFLPWSGPEQPGTQLVHHAHLMFSVGPSLRFGAHYMSTWTDDARLPTEVDGRITTTGFDVKLSDSRYGDGYVGFSHLDSRTPLRIADGLEILHSIAGWTLRDNFFGQASQATGSIDSLLFQHVLSLARLLRYPEPFWGQGPDIVLSVFGMYNHVTSHDKMFQGGKDKFKWGADATYTPLDFLGISLRFDRVQPDLKDGANAFTVLSPRLILRSQFVTHEQLVLQYSHYFNGSAVQPAWQPVQGPPPDQDALMISAIMWW